MQILTEQSKEREAHIFPLWKRGLDVLCIVLALPLILPISLLITAFIWLVSGRPILFRQERVGWRGRRFICLKFRTMQVNADTSGHQAYLAMLSRSDVPMVKLDQKGDSRLIPGARLLRATGLDELPQLINVLRGEMSLVGPRPCLPYEFDQYTEEQKHRLDAIPGLTGLWQVSGKNNTTFNEMIRLDVCYAKNQSFWMDVKIILRTIPALIVQAAQSRTRPNRPVSTTVTQRVS